MNFLHRLRIVLFLVMVFGAFANFAQNEWGNTLIKLCQCLVGCSFAFEAITIAVERIRAKQVRWFNFTFSLVTGVGFIFIPLLLMLDALRTEWMGITAFFFLLGSLFLGLIDLVILKMRSSRKLAYTDGLFENLVLSLCMFSMLCKNLHLPGAGVILVASILFFGVPLYLVNGVRYMREHKKETTSFKMLFYPVYATVVLFGIGMVFKIMHYPFSNMIIASGFAFVLLFLAMMIFKRPIVNGETLSVAQTPKLFKRHVFFLFVLLSLYAGYDSMRRQGMAPGFYESLYPLSVRELNNSNRQEDGEKAGKTMDAYLAFLDHCKSKGYIK